MFRLYLSPCKQFLACKYPICDEKVFLLLKNLFFFFFCRYATGRTTGVVLDSGDGVTHAVPIYEGFALPHSIMRIDIAGRDVSRYLRLLLKREGVNLHTTAEFEIVKTIKEKACYLASNPVKEETVELEKSQYLLPDGSTIEIGPARFRAPEVLFRPDLIGDEFEGLHEVLLYSILKSDLDLRKVLYQNIVLSGGSTLFKGFGDRLLGEIKKIAPKDVKLRVRDLLQLPSHGGHIRYLLNNKINSFYFRYQHRRSGFTLLG